MSSEVFEEIHKALKMHKEHTFVEMLHNNSVMLYGKKYPALNKMLILPKGQRTGRGSVGFEVPFENGHRADFYTDSKHEYNGNPILTRENKYPHTTVYPNDTLHGYESIYIKDSRHAYKNAPINWEEAERLLLHNITPEKFHKDMEDLGKAPTIGFTTNSNDIWRHDQMDKDKLQDFHKNYKNTGESERETRHINSMLVGSGRDYYHYDIKTEQLRKI